MTEDERDERRLWGPPVTAALCASTRDHDDYWRHRPADHGPDGLFVGGPRGELSVLALLIAFTYCAVSAPTPENERRQRVVYRGRTEVQRRADDDVGDDYLHRFARIGRFTGPRKPAASGRRKKVA